MKKTRNTIHKLIQESAVSPGQLVESTNTGDINTSNTRPELLSLTRAVNNLIYTDLVAVQETSLPVATLFGVRYRNPNGDMTFSSAATYSGRFSSRTGIADADLSTALTAGDIIKHPTSDVVYEVIEDIASLSTIDADLDIALMKAVFANKIRLAGEAADVSKYETSTDISTTSFEMDRWTVPVRTRKFKTEMTVELMQDLEANQFNAPDVIEDILGTVSSEEVNKDIIQTLINVSNRYEITGVTDDGVLDLSTLYTDVTPTNSRKLYQLACEMGQEMNRTTSFDATYVLCSARVTGILAASGWLHETDDDHPLASGRLNNGYFVYTDTNSPFDYMLVGCKYDLGEMDHVGSLFYSPYAEADEAGSIKVSVDPASLQPKVAIMMRYGLSVNPYTVTTDGERSTAGDDWSKLAGKSKMSQIIGIKLPKLIQP